MYLHADGRVQVYEAGLFRGTFGTYATGDLLEVWLSSGVVQYRRNGSVFYTSGVVPMYPLLVDASLYEQGAVLGNAMLFGPWTGGTATPTTRPTATPTVRPTASPTARPTSTPTATPTTTPTPRATPSTGVVRNGTLPAPLPLFPADNWWNLDITSAPVAGQSTDFINFIGPTRGMHPDFGGDSGEQPPESLIYGMVYIVVPGTQPLEPVTFTLYGSQSDPGAPGNPPGYPIPVEARTQDRWIEGGLPGGGDDGDRHMLLVDRDQRLLYELWATRWNATLSRWEAGSGAVFDLDTNARRPEGWTSADAAGLAILPGLVRYDEVFGPDPIRHALRFTVRATNGHVYPASHTAGSNPSALPMGARLRLKASKDISGYAAPIRKIFQAMKTYGLIVADNGSDMYVQGAYDTRWDNGVLNPAFDSIKAGDFEVIQLGWTGS